MFLWSLYSSPTWRIDRIRHWTKIKKKKKTSLESKSLDRTLVGNSRCVRMGDAQKRSLCPPTCFPDFCRWRELYRSASRTGKDNWGHCSGLWIFETKKGLKYAPIFHLEFILLFWTINLMLKEKYERLNLFFSQF